MTRILFGAQDTDFYFCASHIAELEDAGYTVSRVSDAGEVLKGMLSGEIDLVIIFGGPMPLGTLAQHTDNGLEAGLFAVAAARKEGSDVPALFLETYFLPGWARRISGTRTIRVSCSLCEFLGEVRELVG